jgi:small neutral amino acid transporter SnatA (MarC family)
MKFFWEVFVTLFVIIDPAGTVQLVANSAIAFAHSALSSALSSGLW